MCTLPGIVEGSMCVHMCTRVWGHGHTCAVGSGQWALRSPASPACLEQMG